MAVDSEVCAHHKWKHSPCHLFVPNAYYIVTAGTYGKENFFQLPERRTALLKSMLEQAESFKWDIQSWSVMPNHYHFVAAAPEDAHTLKRMIQAIHSLTARIVNEEDGTSGRKVWFQYWDTCIRDEKGFLARLNYVHNNPVKHALVADAREYPWCSMKWFVDSVDEIFREKVFSADAERIEVKDDY